MKRLIVGLLLWPGLLWLIPSASAEGGEKLVIEAALDRHIFEPVLAAFSAENPQIELDYRDRSTLEVDQRARDPDSPPPTW